MRWRDVFFVGGSEEFKKTHKSRYILNYFPDDIDAKVFMYWWFKGCSSTYPDPLSVVHKDAMRTLIVEGGELPARRQLSDCHDLAAAYKAAAAAKKETDPTKFTIEKFKSDNGKLYLNLNEVPILSDISTLITLHH